MALLTVDGRLGLYHHRKQFALLNERHTAVCEAEKSECTPVQLRYGLGQSGPKMHTHVSELCESGEGSAQLAELAGRLVPALDDDVIIYEIL